MRCHSRHQLRNSSPAAAGKRATAVAVAVWATDRTCFEGATHASHREAATVFQKVNTVPAPCVPPNVVVP